MPSVLDGGLFRILEAMGAQTGCSSSATRPSRIWSGPSPGERLQVSRRQEQEGAGGQRGL